MRVLVCGGRDYQDRQRVSDTLDSIDAERGIDTVIEGGQRTFNFATKRIVGGADFWAARWAYARCRRHIQVDADWTAHGKAAGPIRNQKMLDERKPDLVVAFPGGSGTADMVKRAKAAGVEVIEVNPTEA